MGRYGAAIGQLWGAVSLYGALWDDVGQLWGSYGALWGSYGALWDDVGQHGAVMVQL